MMIYDTFAQLDKNQINVSGLASGVYLLTVRLDGKTTPASLRFTKK